MTPWYPNNPNIANNMTGLRPQERESEMLPRVPAVKALTMPMTESDVPNHSAVVPLTMALFVQLSKIEESLCCVAT